VLTYQRESMVMKLIDHLLCLTNIEQIIVVDNSPEPKLSEYISENNKITYILGDNDKGTFSRNLGMDKATGDIIICLDDDVFGLSEAGIESLKNEFLNEVNLGAVCFKVLDPSGQISNWCHHCLPSVFSERRFETYEISEGAVAFRRETLKKTGLYAEGFFISHEGLDLALRIINSGYKIVYSPNVKVVHYHAISGRKSWRRYYFDTRNVFIIFKRNFGFVYGIKYALKGVSTMFIYSIRDGFFKYYIKGIFDGIKFLISHNDYRVVVENHTIRYLKKCECNKPSFVYLVKNRVFKRGVKI